MLYRIASGPNWLAKTRSDEQGFTLIELLVVITLTFHKRCYPLPRPN